jgi:hypothetical protein
MTDLEELIARTLHDPARALPVPADPLPAIRARARAQRRAAVLTVAAVAVLAVAAVLVPAALLRPDAALPPATGSSLLDWGARGPLVRDTALVRAAQQAWQERDGVRTVSPVWAGPVAGRKLVLLQGLDRDGRPVLAQLTDDPPAVVRTERLTDPGIPAVRLTGVHPDGPASTAFVLRPGAVAVIPAEPLTADYPFHESTDGLAVLSRDAPGGQVAVVDINRAVLGDGLLDPDGALLLSRSGIGLAAPTWDWGPARQESTDYPAARLLADRLPAGDAGPVEVSVLFRNTWVMKSVSGGYPNPRFYEVRRGGRVWVAAGIWIRETPYCLRFTELTGRLRTVNAVVLRCWLPQANLGLVDVVTTRTAELATLELHTGGGAAEQAYIKRFRPRPPELRDQGYHWSEMWGRDLPTGPGRVRLLDRAGTALPDVEVPAS